MTYDPINLLIDDLVSRIEKQGTGKTVFSNDDSERFELAQKTSRKSKSQRKIER